MVNDSKKALEIKDLTVAYDQDPVLYELDISIPRGQLACIVGPNGAGKTTLLKSILRMVTPTSGSIFLAGEKVEDYSKTIGYVPQRESVDWDFPTTVLDVVMMGRYAQLGWFKRPGKEDKRQAKEALEQVKMEEFAKRQISQLSGGQQQRVFLARALVQKAEIYLMDEPFQGVDAKTEKAIVKVLREFKEDGKTVVVVHHDLQTIADYFDWAVLLNKELVASGPIEQVLTEQNLEITYRGQKKTAQLKAVD